MKHGTVRSGMAAIGVALLTGGCATDTMEDLSYWWQAKVLSVGPSAQVPPGVNRTCIDARGGGAASNDRQAIVVAYRVGKASLVRAFAAPEGTTWSAGDTVLIHVDTCRVKQPNARPA